MAGRYALICIRVVKRTLSLCVASRFSHFIDVVSAPVNLITEDKIFIQEQFPCVSTLYRVRMPLFFAMP